MASMRLALRLAVSSIALTLALSAAPAAAQPFGLWTVFPGTGYIRVPSSAALNPTAAFTFEAWVNPSGGTGGCPSIAGKDYHTTWWIGVCSNTLRSYLKGGTSQRNGGTVPSGQWTHVAVVFNGTQRLHYINGELVATFAETGPLPTNTAEMRIGGDVSWVNFNGTIDEVRLWNVARTTAQLRAAINVPITSAQAGLVAVWDFTNDVVGPRDGTLQGTGVVGFTFPVALNCGGHTATSYCVQDTHFVVSARFRVGAPGTAEGTAQTLTCSVCQESGIFTFFAPTNWEVMFKVLNGCGLNDRFWVFSAATTNVFYRLEVFDIRAGVNKVYFNYPGPPAPAVTDVNAFATCP
jgi:concanavalin A-like lectin/glucanase superfamily protein